MASHLVFVYNADSGLFNTLGDVAHKIFSPHTYRCSLCALTHTPFAMRRAWRQFLEALPAEPLFLHRDEFAAHYPEFPITPPVVLMQTADGALSVCLDAETLGECESLEALESLLTARCLGVPCSDSIG
jgi:hypothetical protein